MPCALALPQFDILLDGGLRHVSDGSDVKGARPEGAAPQLLLDRRIPLEDLPGGDAGPCATSGGVSFGMICSLSIPIITICALILLIIIATVVVSEWVSAKVRHAII